LTRREKRQWRLPSALRERRLLLRIVGVGVAAFLIGYAITAIFFFPGGGSDVVTVPDLRGLAESEARRELDRQGLEIERGSTLVHPEIPAGAVLAQSPLPGQEAAPGSAVRVTLSAGRDRREVPDVSSLTGDQALRFLSQAGFQVVMEQRPAARRAGHVLEISPAAGTQVELPAQVRLVVSAGPPRVPIPQLVGLPEPVARQMLESVGLRLGSVDYDPFSSYPLGEVVYQEPAEGDSLAVGSAVRVTIAGVAPVRQIVPDVPEPGAATDPRPPAVEVHNQENGRWR
jgi:beta-lactam-binding protein with PASTA domain